MTADGLNKGSIDRAAIQDILQKNFWKRVGDKPCTLTAYIASVLLSALEASKGQGITHSICTQNSPGYFMQR